MKLLKQKALELRRRRRKFWIVVGIGCFVIFCCMGAVGWVGLSFTSSPRFCLTCHFMQPYYDSWTKSKHKDVTCTDCHFEPGLKSLMKGKFLGLAQVVKYVTGTQGSRPAAEIADESCLRSGCHDTRLLQAKTLRESWLLLDDDVRDWAGFCSRFSEQNGSDSPSFVKRMAEFLPADTLAAIQEGAKAPGPREEAKTRIVADINLVLKRQGIYNEDHFADVSVPDEVEGFVTAVPGSLGRRQTERLNRLLLEATFPQAVRNSQLFKGAPFDHIKHMKSERRGKKLRCVSCHSQMVQGQHMVVTETTCFLCHFKEQPFNEDQGKCATCHETPTKTVVRNGMEFSHRTVKEREITCDKCHLSISRGAGQGG